MNALRDLIQKRWKFTLTTGKAVTGTVEAIYHDANGVPVTVTLDRGEVLTWQHIVTFAPAAADRPKVKVS